MKSDIKKLEEFVAALDRKYGHPESSPEDLISLKMTLKRDEARSRVSKSEEQLRFSKKLLVEAESKHYLVVGAVNNGGSCYLAYYQHYHKDSYKNYLDILESKISHQILSSSLLEDLDDNAKIGLRIYKITKGGKLVFKSFIPDTSD